MRESTFLDLSQMRTVRLDQEPCQVRAGKGGAADARFEPTPPFSPAPVCPVWCNTCELGRSLCHHLPTRTQFIATCWARAAQGLGWPPPSQGPDIRTQRRDGELRGRGDQGAEAAIWRWP